MSEIIIPILENKNLKDLYVLDEIRNNFKTISESENAQELCDEYFSQLTSFSFDVYNLEKTFENNECNFEQKLEILFRSIESNYELISSWYEDSDFSEIVQNDLILKNLILIYKHTGKDPREFIKEQKQAGLTNNMIAGILNFDTLDFLLRLLQKDIINFNPDDLASNLFKEILVTVFIQRAFKICIESIKTCKIPTEAFEEQKFIELIYLFFTQIFVYKTEVTMEDVQLAIKLTEISLANYHKIRENYNFKEGGGDEIYSAIKNYFGFEETPNEFNINPNNAQINLLETFPDKNFTSIELEFIFNRLRISFSNITYLKNCKELLRNNLQIQAIFSISNLEKYPIIINITKTNFVNVAINILKNQPKYLEQVVKIFSCYSIDNVLWETISKNDYIQKNYPNFLELVIECKIKYIREKTKIDSQNINPKAVAAINENDSPEVINAIISLGDSIDLIDFHVINFIRQDVSKYAPVITNILKAESINDITLKTINFFANLKNTDETKILLSRFDLFEPIVKKMYEENIEIEKINKVINWTSQKFKESIPQKFSDEIIYSNTALKNSFNCLLQKLINNNLNSFYRFFPKIPEAEKMRKEIERELYIRNYPKEAPKILKQKIKNMLSFGIPDIISLVAIAIVIGLTFGAGIISSPLFIALTAIFGVASLILSIPLFKNLASWFKNKKELIICNNILLGRNNYNITKEQTQPVLIETQNEVEQQNGVKPKVYEPLLQTPEVKV